jgi:PAS domain S-box-containing protein
MTEDLFYKTLMDNLYDGVYFVDRDRRITYWNKGAERITGYPKIKVVGTFCHDNLLNHVIDNGKHLCQDGCPLLATIQDGSPREAEVYLHHADGHRLPVLARTSPIHDESNNVIGVVEVFSNNKSLFKMRRKVDQLEQAVLVDQLTDVGNRAYAELKIKSPLPYCFLISTISSRSMMCMVITWGICHLKPFGLLGHQSQTCTDGSSFAHRVEVSPIVNPKSKIASCVV